MGKAGWAKVELRLGWVIFGCFQGGSEVDGGFQREEVFVSIGINGRGEGVLAIVEHGAGVVGSEVARSSPEIEEDSIGFPAAMGMDCSLVGTRDKESGGTARAEAVSFDAIRRDVSDVVDGTSGAQQFGCVVVGHDVMRAM